ncbi:LysR family transcriptional regulator [Caminibacter pacificus]
MTLKELEVFYRLADKNHMVEVAKELGISQAAVSLAIKSLEKSIGEKLFERIGKKIVLNEYGRKFYDETFMCYEKLMESQKMFSKDKISGRLKILSSRSFGNFIIPKIIVNFLKRYENVKISHVIKNSSDIIKDILEAKADLGIIETEIDDVDIVKEKIGSDRLIIVSKNKKLAEKEVFIDSLFGKKWILREKGSGTREMFLNAIGDLRKEINVFLECSEFDEIKNFLLEDEDIITCISEYAVKEEIKEKKLFEIKAKNIDLRRNFYLVYHKDKYRSKLFETFREFLKSN